jgi:hypothetical protein
MIDHLDAIAAGNLDSGGREILAVYTIVYGRYAIYRTRARVLVQFSPDPALCDHQRSLLSRLGPIRSQINGLVDDWRTSSDGESMARAAIFDDRVAAALAVALDGDAEAAERLLEKIHFDILEERVATAAVGYVLWAAAATGAAMLLACIFTSSQYRLVFEYSTDAYALWLGVGTGALGAFFSIAVAARSRAILTNVQRRRENRMDAIVRITIGSIAGMLLAGLLQARLISFTIGGVASTGQSNGWMLVAFGAFVAGFSERLIPNLLDRSGSPPSGYASTERPNGELPRHNMAGGGTIPAGLTATIPAPQPINWRPPAAAIEGSDEADAAAQGDRHWNVTGDSH